MLTLAALDIGGTYIKYGVVEYQPDTQTAAILWHASVETQAQNGVDDVLARIANVVAEIHQRTPNVHAVGIGVPGVVDPSTRIVQHPPNLRGWEDVDLLNYVYHSPLHNPSVPVYVENDANCGAIAELHAGAGRGLKEFVYVTLGTGIGGGLVVDGRLYAGPHGEAGEIGHMLVSTGHKLEIAVGRNGIMQMYHARTGAGEVDVDEIDHRAEAGEADAIDVLTTAGTLIGETLGSALVVLGIRTIIIGGGMSNSRTLMLSIEAAVRKVPVPTIARHLSVHRAHFIDHAGLVGAALLGVA